MTSPFLCSHVQNHDSPHPTNLTKRNLRVPQYYYCSFQSPRERERTDQNMCSMDPPCGPPQRLTQSENQRDRLLNLSSDVKEITNHLDRIHWVSLFHLRLFPCRHNGQIIRSLKCLFPDQTVKELARLASKVTGRERRRHSRQEHPFKFLFFAKYISSHNH